MNEPIINRIKNTVLFEMAVERSRYMDAVRNLSHQIVQNWCLVCYCSFYNKNNLNLSHWKSELKAHLYKLTMMKIATNKRKATLQALKEENLGNLARVFDILYPKWEDEGLDIRSNKSQNVSEAFVDYGIFEIVELISSPKSSAFDVTQYIETI